MPISPLRIGKLGLVTTSAFVIANMVGTGIFTSLGFQVAEIDNIITILALWLIGGVIALCGSLVYSELGAAMPRSGGEYHYLSKIYSPWLGFLSGWVSVTVGFAAPVALAAMAFGSYITRVFPTVSPEMLALLVVAILTIIHSYDIKFGGRFQNLFTSFKIVLILSFVIAGLIFSNTYQDISPSVSSFSLSSLISPAIFVPLIYVTYAFSGWNASAYIAGDISNPQRIIPRSLVYSTLIVTALYFLLNFTFLLTTPISELKGQVDIGYISATKIFGPTGGGMMAMLIAILLISTISSMVFVGPRISQVMGEDMPMLGFLAKKSTRNTPVNALILQFCISAFFIITATFESVLTYAGFTLNLFTLLTVLGVFIHRYKFKEAPRPYKTWGYPFVPLVYLAVICLSLGYLIYQRPYESFFGFITVMAGIVLYKANSWFVLKNNDSSEQ